MIVDSARRWKLEDLLREIESRWGATARFHTCSAEGLDAAGLIRFLSARGKFIENGDGVVMDESKICEH